jgi:LuxR family maltose regulon positive regulatory protein
MGVAVLATKTFPPPAHAPLVARERLFAKMGDAIEQAARLILVCAPAGFGKSTLVAAWAGRLQVPVAWLSLDDQDAVPERFVTYLIAAIQRVRPGFAADLLERIHRGEASGLPTLLPELINALGDDAAPLLVILDDYHVIDEPAIHAGVAFLVDRAPPGVTLLLATRVVPPLSLPRLRARRELVDIRLQDLRFTTSEIAELLNDLHALGLHPHEITTLEARTEGWAAGLQLAAMALPTDDAQRRDFISGFSGSQEYIADYLLEEVLSRAPAALIDFLLRVSILDRFSASLCQALTDEPDGEAMLHDLLARNAFLIPLDAERQWFRLHRLFADLLRKTLQRDRAPLVPELHLRASAWFEAHGYVQDALGHALAGRHFLTAQRLVEENWTAMLHHGHITVTLRWLETLPRMATQPNLMPGVVQSTLAWLSALPATVVEGYPGLHRTHAWALFLSGRLDEVEAHLQRSEQALAHAPQVGRSTSSEAELRAVHGDMEVLRVFLLHARGEHAAAVEWAHLARSRIEGAEPVSRGGLQVVLGHAYGASRQPELAATAFREGVALLWQSGNTIGTLSAYAGLIGLYRSQAKLPLAERTAREALQLMDEHQILRIAAAGVVYLEWAAVLLEQNRPSEAASALDLAAEVAVDSGLRGFRERCAALRGRVAAAPTRRERVTRVEPLTARELQVLTLVAEGRSNQAIAERLGISLPTVKKHVSNILAKTRAPNRTTAIARAREVGLL